MSIRHAVSLEISEDAHRVEKALMRAGIVDPELTAEKILTEFAAKMLAGKSAAMARHELLIEISFRRKIGYALTELETMFQDLGEQIAEEIKTFEFEFPRTERYWRLERRDVRMMHLRCD
jgi:hypothetical protein